jgi:uncharacterized protein
MGKRIMHLHFFAREAVPSIPQPLQFKTERTLKNYLKYLEDGGIIISLSKMGTRLGALEKPEKIYLNNPNQIYAMSGRGKENIGTIRETFFINTLSVMHKVSMPKKGDFCVDDQYTFEIGGRNKGFKQIIDVENAFLALDNMETGIGNKVPLWLFGFLY